MDDQAPMDKTPYNARADFREVDNAFRNRLDSLIPQHLADRIQNIIKRRENEFLDGEKSDAVNE